MVTLLLLLLPLALVGVALDSGDDEERPEEEPEIDRRSDGGDLLDEPDETEGRADLERTSPPEMRTTEDGRRLIIADDEGSVVVASPGDDVVFAGAGDDAAVGGSGNDEIFLGDGDDEGFRRFGRFGTGGLYGDEGDDLIRGGAGSDEIKDRQGADRLYGDTGNDILDTRDTIGTTAAADSLFGGLGRDVLIADAGDVVSGGANPDRFAIAQSSSDDAPVIITDYEPQEILAIELQGASPDEVSLGLSESGEDLEIRLAGQLIGRLEGVTDPTVVRLDYIDTLEEQYSFTPPRA